jgi:hypothetical protein
MKPAKTPVANPTERTIHNDIEATFDLGKEIIGGILRQ